MNMHVQLSDGDQNHDIAFLETSKIKELAKKWQEEGDENARNCLVVSFLPLIVAIVQRYIRKARFDRCIEKGDMVSEGVCGLLQAVDKYDYEHGTQFAFYASRCIRNKIRSHITRFYSIVRPPDDPITHSLIFGGLEREKRKRGIQGALSPEDVSSIAGARRGHQNITRFVDTLFSQNVISLEQPISPSRGSENQRAFSEILPSELPTPEEEFAEKERRELCRSVLRNALSAIKASGRDKSIFKAYYNLLGRKAKSTSALCTQYGISNQRVHQILNDVSSKLLLKIKKDRLASDSISDIFEAYL